MLNSYIMLVKQISEKGFRIIYKHTKIFLHILPN